ncbi:hypothetical protein HYX04_05080 [Candidatus Woesearchaeota archaeon]|nr:hypothetical protein [Candidatus Woesearchaeota archaeon]
MARLTIKMGKFFIPATILLVLANIAFAASFDVKVTPINDNIVVDEVAEFDIAVQNNLDVDEEYTIKKAGYPFWDMYTKPLQNPITLKVPAQSTLSIRLFVDPLYITSVDTYTLDVGVVSGSSGQEQKAPITVGIKSTEPLIGGYIPTVLTSTSISPEKIDPRGEFTIKIVLNNQNVLDYPNLTVRIESNLFKDELFVPLGPKEDKTIEVTKKLDPMTIPQEDRLVIAIFKDERLIVSPIVKEFGVIEYVTQEDIPKEQSFLKIRKGVKVESNNPDYNGVVKVETTPLKNLFVTTFPRAEITKEDGKHYLVWQVVVGSDRTISVYTTENYRPIVVIIVLVIAAVALYFLFRSPIVVRKGIGNVGMSEGGISEAKIVVRVKNRSANQITDIEVMDNLPHIAHVERELSIGSMQPHAILKHPKKGLMIKWNIETLEAGDERVLSYRMKSRLPILGELSLPAASARTKVGEKVIISNSNRVSVGG